jgi:hypothetical protein
MKETEFVPVVKTQTAMGVLGNGGKAPHILDLSSELT